MGTEAELRAFFSEVVTAFNNHQDLTRFLDANATVFSVGHHQPHSGQQAAAAYITQQYQDNPSFSQPADPIVTLNARGTGAIIQGTTTWKDNNRPNGEPLKFCCTFVYNSGWLISTLWAA